jgi:hypothetical protein
MNPRNFLPANDWQFLQWTTNFLTVLTKNLTRLGFLEEVYQELEGLFATFKVKLDLADAPETRTKSAVQAKNDARKALERRLRECVAEYLTNNHLLTDVDRDNLGLPIHDTKPTSPPLPTDMPQGEVGTGTQQQQHIRVKSGTLTGVGKPPKVHGVEVWRKVGGEPLTDDSEYSFVCLSTRTAIVLEFPLTGYGQDGLFPFPVGELPQSARRPLERKLRERCYTVE